MKNIWVIIFILFTIRLSAQQEEHEYSHNHEHEHEHEHEEHEHPKNNRDFSSYTLNILENPDSTLYKDSIIDNLHNFLPQQKVSFNNLGFTDPGNPFTPAVFALRPKDNDFWFLNHYSPYIKTHDNILYFDTRQPFSLLNFVGGAKKLDMLKLIHSQNINESLNFTFIYDIINDFSEKNPGGHYTNNQDRIHSLALSGAYTKHKYQAHANFIFNKLTTQENGGIKDEDKFSDPNFRPENLESNLTNSNNIISQLGGQYNQEYRFGSYSTDTVIIEKDTVINKILNNKFSIIHDIKFDRFFRIYKDIPNGFYNNNFLNHSETYDSTVYHLTDNRFYVNFLLNGNGKISKFQVLAGFRNTFNYYQILNKVEQFTNSKNEIVDTIRYAKFFASHYLSGILKFETSKSQFNGEVNYGVAARNVFDIDIKANYNQYLTNFLNFDAYFNFERKTSEIFYSFYKSNNFKWNNEDLSKINNTRGGIDFNFHKWKFNIGTNLNLIHNYFVFDTLAIPKQISKTNFIADLYIKNLLKLGPMHWFNQLTYQYISDRSNVPLPEFIVYSNLYFKKDILNKVMILQIGIDFKYHSKIYGYAYMPAIGAFYLQNIKEIGDYPNASAYIAMKIKSLRAFVKASNASSLITPRNYYLLYQIPDNPMSINFGISWEFYD